jgi:aminoglycoside 6'-N-acetyltransferase I
MTIREYEPGDWEPWLRMRRLLWPEIVEELEGEESDAQQWLARKDACVLIAEADGAVVGFLEVGERAFADECSTFPVGYLEGWYVDESSRRRGAGRALLKAAEIWATARGYREFASDALLENVESQQAHEAVGFKEVERAVRYVKTLRVEGG